MKKKPVLTWALLIALALPSAAFADVCEKDSQSRIKVVEMQDRSLALVYMTTPLSEPAWVGPNFTFTPVEIEKKRNVENVALEKVGIRKVGQALKLLTIILVGGYSKSNAQLPLGPTSDEVQRAKEAKEKLTVLEKTLFKTSTACTYVPSIEKHRETLARVLSEIYAQRFTMAKVATPKVERDQQDDKTVADAGIDAGTDSRSKKEAEKNSPAAN